MDKLYIVIPAYNESENIRKVIEEWHRIVKGINPESRLVVIDDGSRDHTFSIIKDMKRSCEQLEVLTKENQGHGATILYGYRYAIKSDADYIFQTDSDGQTIPEEFWRLWDDRETAGLLLGHRKKRQDGWQRIVVTQVLQLVIWLSFRVWIADANVPFRLMRAQELKSVLRSIPRNYHLSNIMMTIVYKKQGRFIKFYPITFLPRQGGENSINIKRIFVMGSRAAAEFMKLGKCG